MTPVSPRLRVLESTLNQKTMTNPTRRDILKFGAALPLAMHSLNLCAANKTTKAPPKRIVFICNSLGFYEPNFFPTKQGDLETSEVPERLGGEGQGDGFSKPLPSGHGDQQP